MTHCREDKVVLNFFKNFVDNLTILDAGSGLGRFASIIKLKFNFKLFCIDINKNLIDLLSKKGFNSKVDDIRQTKFKDEKFDIVHCSHVIEHFGYPDIRLVLNELFRITKIGGFVIIRSPLINPDFYIDIDHVRPYPPDCILSFFNNIQQQQIGAYHIKEVKRWYRRSAINIRFMKNSRIVSFLNNMFKYLWIEYNFPFSKRNGFVVIFKKIKSSNLE
jgi:ubiquinone/menaquinone biosynthesis C-methylase UbiE